jgi:hypothetical protein
MNMSKINYRYREYFRSAALGARELMGCVSEEDIARVLAILKASDYPSLNRVCYVYGAGSHPKSTYTEMIGKPGIVVINFESILPRGLRFLPSYRGLVRIDDPVALSPVFNQLIEQATAAILIFDRSLENAFVSMVRSFDEHGDYGFGITTDPGHVAYLVDGDCDDCPSGMMQFVSCGRDGAWDRI